jgi:hypothetical protein
VGSVLCIRDRATSERPAGHWHPGCELHQHRRSKLVHALARFGHRKAFICGRALSKEYKPFTREFFVDAMKCQQCDKGQLRKGSRQLQLAQLSNAHVRAECDVAS